MSEDRTLYLKRLKQIRDNALNQGNATINPTENNYSVGNNLEEMAMLNTETPDVPERLSDTFTGSTLKSNLAYGMFQGIDAISDAVITVGGGIAKFFKGMGTLFTDGSFEKGWNDPDLNWGIEHAINYDWESSATKVINKLDMSDELLSGELFTKDYWTDWSTIGNNAKTKQDVLKENKSSYFHEIPYLSELEQGVGQALPQIALAFIPGGHAAKIVGQTALAGVQSLGTGTEQAISEGQGFDKAVQYGLGKGVVSAGINAITYGLGAGLGSKMGEGAVGKLSEKIGSSLATKTGNAKIGAITTKLINLGIDGLGEGVEEMTEDLLDPVVKQITIDGNAITNAYQNGNWKQTLQNAAISGGVAFLVSGVVQGGVEIANLEIRTKANEGVKLAAEIQNDVSDLKTDLENGKISEEEANIKIEEIKEKTGELIDVENDIIDNMPKQDEKNTLVLEEDNDIKVEDNADFSVLEETESDVDVNEKVEIEEKTPTETYVENQADIDESAKKVQKIKEPKPKRETPEIDTDKTYPSELVKSKADVDKNVKYARNDSERIVEDVISEVNTDLGDTDYIKFDIGKKDFIRNKAFNELNLKDNDVAIDTIFKQVVDNGTIEIDGEDFNLDFIFKKEDLADLKAIIKEKVDSYGKPTYKIKSETEINRLKEKFKKAHKDFASERKAVARTYKITKAIKNKFVDPKAFTIGGDIQVPEVNFFKNAIDNIYPSIRYAGVSPVGLTKFIKAFENYDVNNLDSDIIEFNEAIKANVELLKLSPYFDENGNYKNMHVATEDVELLNDTLKLINAELKNIKSKKVQHDIEIARDSALYTERIANAYGVKGVGNFKLLQFKDSAMNLPTLFKTYLGEYHPLTKHITDNYIKAMNNEIRVKSEFSKKASVDIPEELGIDFKTIEKQLKGKAEIDGYKLTNSELLDIYFVQKTAGDSFFENGIELAVKGDKKSKIIKLTEEEFKTQVVEKLPTDLKAWGDKIYTELYNKEFGDYVSEKYYERFKVEMGRVENYYPTQRAAKNNLGLETNNIDQKGFITDIRSNVKKRIANKNAYAILPYDQRFDSYVNNIAFFGEKGDWVNTLRIMLNKKIGKINTNQFLKTIIPNWGKWNDYMTKIVLERPINPTKTDGGEILQNFYSNSVGSLLGANPGTMLRQVLSLAQYLNTDGVGAAQLLKRAFTSVKNLSPGRWKEISDILERETPYFAQRWDTYESIRAMTGGKKANKFQKLMGWGMEKVDKAVIVGVGWELAQDYATHYKANEISRAKQTGELDLINEAELINTDKIAAQWLSRVVLETQSNSDPMFMSRLRSGDLGTIAKYTLGMFGSDGQNLAQAISKQFFEFRYSKKRVKYLENELLNSELDPATRAGLEEQLALEQASYNPKTFRRTMSHNIASLVLIGVGSALINELMDRFKGRKDWGDKISPEEFGLDVLLEGTVNWLPYIGTVANAFESNGDLTVFTVERVNQLIDVTKNFVKAIQTGNSNDIKRAVFGLTKVLDVLGIPATNLYNTVLGTIRITDQFSGADIADKITHWTKGYSSNFIKSMIGTNINEGMYKKATTDLGTWEYLYSIPQSEQVNKTLIKLKSEGFDSFPRATLTYYQDEKGNKVNLTRQQKNTFNSYYKQATKEIEYLMESNDFNNLTSDEKSKAIRIIYDSHFELAKAKTLKRKPVGRLGKILSMKKTNLPLNKLAIAMAKIKTIQATDKGSRKELVFKYVKSLKGLNKNQKLLLLWLSGYKINNAGSLEKAFKNIGLTNKEIKEILNPEKPKKK